MGPHTVAHWGKNPQFIQKFSFGKSHFWTKFTFSKSHFWQNSHFQNHIFHKIHNFKASFSTKFTFFRHQIIGNIWIRKLVYLNRNTVLTKTIFWHPYFDTKGRWYSSYSEFRADSNGTPHSKMSKFWSDEFSWAGIIIICHHLHYFDS